jgi:hypothetical protein
MVGAPPDNIGAKRLAEDGEPASGAGSAKKGSNHHARGRLRHQCHTRQPNKVAKMAP